LEGLALISHYVIGVKADFATDTNSAIIFPSSPGNFVQDSCLTHHQIAQWCCNTQMNLLMRHTR
jgi:hypothetical protein